MKVVHFGAGKIGRGFIAELLHDTGYEIVFADVFQPLIEELNQYHNYYLYSIENNHERKEIDKVSALSTINQGQEVIDEIVNADLVTTAVIVDNFPKIAGLLAKALKARLDAGKEKVNVIACENAPYCGNILAKELVNTGEITEEELNKIAAIPNQVVDRMVFSYEENGRMGIEVGNGYELVIEKNRLIDPESEPIKGAHYTGNIEKYLERKLYVVNGGHTGAGYVAHLQGYEIIQDYFASEAGFKDARDRMLELSAFVEKKHGFDHQDMVDYVDYSLNRWMTPGVQDPISRISRAPIRKLAPKDRLVQPALGLEAYGLEDDLIVKSIAAGYLFYLEDDAQSKELKAFIEENGIEKALKKYSDLDANEGLGKKVLEAYHSLKK